MVGYVTHRYWDSIAGRDFLSQQPEELREVEEEERVTMLKSETVKDSQLSILKQ